MGKRPDTPDAGCLNNGRSSSIIAGQHWPASRTSEVRQPNSQRDAQLLENFVNLRSFLELNFLEEQIGHQPSQP